METPKKLSFLYWFSLKLLIFIDELVPQLYDNTQRYVYHIITEFVQ